MTDEAIEKAFNEYRRGRAVSIKHKYGFIAGYQAGQLSLAGTLKHLEEGARILRMATGSLYEGEQRADAWERWLAVERLSNPEEDTHG